MEKVSFELEPESFLYRRAILKYEANGVKHEKEFIFFKTPICMDIKISEYLKKSNIVILNIPDSQWSSTTH
jgi:hypothetical protein